MKTVESINDGHEFFMYHLSLKGFMIVTVCTAVALGRKHHVLGICTRCFGWGVLRGTLHEE